MKIWIVQKKDLSLQYRINKEKENKLWKSRLITTQLC